MRVKAVIFDFDGIILDSSGVAFNVLEEIAQEEKLNLEVENKVYWGLSGLRVLEKLLPGASWRVKGKVYWRCQIKESKLSIPLFPRALEVILALKEKGIVIGLLTNRNICSLKFYGGKFSIDYKNLFDFIQTVEGKDWFFKKIFRRKIHSNHFTSKIYKPDVGVFDKALKFLKIRGIKKEETIYVADTIIDSIASWLAGVEFVAIVSHGPLDRKDFNSEPVKVKYILDSIEELPEFLEKLK